MALTKKQYKEIRDELDSTIRPLFLFDDDADGLCSFLLLYRYVKEGQGVIVKAAPIVEEMFVSKVKNYSPDKIFVVDMPMISEEFSSQVNEPLVWIDHHEPQKTKYKYYNPRVKNPADNIPATYHCFKSTDEKDLWIAAVGCIGDWYIPDFIDQFIEKYPDLLPKKYTKIEDILYKTKVGTLVELFFFLLKGTTSTALKNVKVLTRIDSPYEILNQESPQGKFIWKNYLKLKIKFDELYEDAIQNSKKTKDFLIYIYDDQQNSFTSEVSNKLSAKYTNKVLIIGRRHYDEMKLSIRSNKKIINEWVTNSVAGLRGYGGGHEHACGCVVHVDDYDIFVERMKEYAKKS